MTSGSRDRDPAGRGSVKKAQGCRVLRHFLVAILATVSCRAFANAETVTISEHAHECFRSHLREAIELNRERRTLYANASGGRSTAVSNTLIFLEELALAGSHFTHDFDKLDRVYKRAGMNVLCENFVPMSMTPAFKARYEGPAPLASSFKELKASDVKTRLKLALKNEGFSGVKKEADLWIAHLAREPRMNCLMRHTLDSIVRVATLAPRHAEKARSLGLPSPEKLERRLIESHWALLDQVHRLDRRASKLQADGLPIVCNDVPSLAL
jgi:hypothetical protein